MQQKPVPQDPVASCLISENILEMRTIQWYQINLIQIKAVQKHKYDHAFDIDMIKIVANTLYYKHAWLYSNCIFDVLEVGRRITPLIVFILLTSMAIREYMYMYITNSTVFVTCHFFENCVERILSKICLFKTTR